VIGPEELLAACERAVGRAQALGAEQVEVFAESGLSTEVELQKDDIHTASTSDETSFGVRVLRGGSQGFATVNGIGNLEAACSEALAIAAVAPADEFNQLPDPRAVERFERVPDAALRELRVDSLVDLAGSMLAEVRARDPRVRIDTGGVAASVHSRALASSTGIALCEAGSEASSHLFGMAVDGDDVGSFDYDSSTVLRADALAPALSGLTERFVEKCLGSLGTRSGESFRGTLVLSPEVVQSFLLGDLLPVLSAKAVRTGRSPLAERLGQSIAAKALNLIDDPRLPEGTASGAFDREGMPTRRCVLVDRGVLQTFLYDAYEAQRAEVEPTGHACGGAAALPRIGTSNLLVSPGDTPYEKLCREPDRGILVTRFSGQSSAITGEFSGVVKGGFLLRQGERVPIRETMIAGNLYDLLHSISGVSSELTNLNGCALLPAIRVEDVSITAG